jgi:hypothetical protein
MTIRDGKNLVVRTMQTASDGTLAALDAGQEFLATLKDLTPVEVMDRIVETAYTAFTVEFALFPFLFPQGRGYFRPGRHGFRTLTSYLRHRMHQLFSAFTLYKVFLLLMYQLQQCDRLSREVGAWGCCWVTVNICCERVGLFVARSIPKWC